MQFKAILVTAEEGQLYRFPALPGCISQGDIRNESLANIREAIELYLEPVEDDIA